MEARAFRSIRYHLLNPMESRYSPVLSMLIVRVKFKFEEEGIEWKFEI